MESLTMTEEFKMDDLLAQEPDAKAGTIVEGEVVGKTEEHLIANIGLKQEALISLNEFGTNPPAVGTKISVLILRVSGPEGRPVVSWKQARERGNWDKIEALFKSNQIIPGVITQKIKGGVLVDIGLDAFMPASQIDLRPVNKPEEWLGKSVDVLVLEMDRAKHNVLVSRRRVIENEKNLKRAVTLENLQVGQIRKGRVTGLTSFGAFVDIGGIEGLLHVSDMAWTRVEKPETVLKVGDELDVKVLKHDPASNRISLGRKQLLTHPWEGIQDRFPIGSTVKGKVTGLADFGAFVEIEPGIEGLIHVSELSWTERHKKPHSILKVGQVIETKLIGIDREKEKISLSLRRMQASPWEDAAKNFPLRSRVEGEITHITNFGLFVKIAPGIEALLKTQDLSWTERVTNPGQMFKVGDKISAIVLEVNPKEEKMALGLKQLTPDPVRSLKVGAVVNATIKKISDAGAVVKLESGIESFIRISELTLDRSIFDDSSAGFRDRKNPVQRTAADIPYKEGDVVQATITKIGKGDRQLELSVRRYEKSQERELLKKYSGGHQKLTLGETTGWGSDTDKDQ